MRKVLVSAYACEPGKGSEPEVGWQWVHQIARFHEVWVITRANNRLQIEESLYKAPTKICILSMLICLNGPGSGKKVEAACISTITCGNLLHIVWQETYQKIKDSILSIILRLSICIWDLLSRYLIFHLYGVR